MPISFWYLNTVFSMGESRMFRIEQRTMWRQRSLALYMRTRHLNLVSDSLNNELKQYVAITLIAQPSVLFLWRLLITKNIGNFHVVLFCGSSSKMLELGCDEFIQNYFLENATLLYLLRVVAHGFTRAFIFVNRYIYKSNLYHSSVV